jgi:hypothetical protein
MTYYHYTLTTFGGSYYGYINPFPKRTPPIKHGLVIGNLHLFGTMGWLLRHYWKSVRMASPSIVITIDIIIIVIIYDYGYHYHYMIIIVIIITMIITMIITIILQSYYNHITYIYSSKCSITIITRYITNY